MTSVSTRTSRALDLLYGLVVDQSGRTWGETALPWQREDARNVLDVDSPVRRAFCTRPRGGRKTADAGGWGTAVLLTQAPPGARCYCISLDQDNAAHVVDSIRAFRSQTPGLANALHITGNKVTALVRWEADGRTVPVADGPTFEALPSDHAGANGLRPYFAVLDELCHWPDHQNRRDLYFTMLSLMEKDPRWRLAVISNAGSPSHFSYRERQKAAASRHWRLHEVPGPLPWLTDDQLEALRQDAQSPAEFARLHENVWMTGDDQLTTREDVEACLTLDGPLPPRYGTRYVVALDVGVVNDRTAAVVAHLEPLEQRWSGAVRETSGVKVVLDRIEVWKGSRLHPVKLANVAEWVHQACSDYGAQLIYDPYQAVSLAQDLQGRGVRAEAFTFSSSSVGRLASTLYRLLRDHALALPNDPDLVDELLHVQMRETSPGTYRLDHARGRHDDRAISLALAAYHLLEGTRAERAMASRPQILVGPRWGRLGMRDHGGSDPRALALLEHLAQIGDVDARAWVARANAAAAAAYVPLERWTSAPR